MAEKLVIGLDKRITMSKIATVYIPYEKLRQMNPLNARLAVDREMRRQAFWEINHPQTTLIPLVP